MSEIGNAYSAFLEQKFIDKTLTVNDYNSLVFNAVKQGVIIDITPPRIPMARYQVVHAICMFAYNEHIYELEVFNPPKLIIDPNNPNDKYNHKIEIKRVSNSQLESFRFH